MESFKEWLVENKEDILYLGNGKWWPDAWVIFAIRGVRWKYYVDPLFLEDREFNFLIRKGYYGKALNLAKKRSYKEEKVQPKVKPKPKPEPKPEPEQKNWPEDWELESRKQQARMQGMRIPY